MRAGRGLRHLLSAGWLRKSQQRRFVRVNGQICKRLLLRDSYLAAEFERNLEAFGPSEMFPPLITRFENEIWVEFVPGERLRRVDDRVMAAMAGFYGALYARAPRQVALAETPYADRVQRDLRFLHRAGLIDDGAWRDLAMVAEALAPARLWFGFDYVDPVLKNFVWRADNGRLCAVDVESLVCDQPIGTGIAKAAVHWLGPAERADLLARLDPAVPDFQADLPFVELAFLARWTKTKLLTGKTHLVDPARLMPFRVLAGTEPASGAAPRRTKYG